MCGRYSLAVSAADLPRYFAENNLNVDQTISDASFNSSYNLGPTKTVPVYYVASGSLSTIEYMKWGLIPFFTKSAKEAQPWRTFNARKESLEENKPMWRNSKNHRRCVVPIQGYYEWSASNSGKLDKIPYYIKKKDPSQLMYLAGVFESVTYRDTNETIKSFAIVTGPSPNQLKWLHDRMPIVLTPGTPEMDNWLNPDLEWSEKIYMCLHDYNDSDLEWYKVNKDVGKMTNDGAYLIKPLKEAVSIFDHFSRSKKEEIKEEIKDTKDIKEDIKIESPTATPDLNPVSNLIKNEETWPVPPEKSTESPHRSQSSPRRSPKKPVISPNKRSIIDMLSSGRSNENSKKRKT